MTRTTPLLLSLALAACATTKAPRESIHGLTVTDIDGRPQPLAQYAGKVLVVVNVASRCGFTYQYAGLEQLYREYKDRGVVVLGFPSNDFAGQEPGAEPEIKKFCSLKYDVTFPMFAKVVTTGRHKSPLYEILARDGAPRWNFYKFVVGKDGRVRERFSSVTKPGAKSLRAAIDEALQAPFSAASTAPEAAPTDSR